MSSSVSNPYVTHADPGREQTVTPPFRGDSAWHVRYRRSATAYDAMELTPELLHGLTEGLREWASILPQVEVSHYGRHNPVNSWGLGPEMAMLWRLEIILEMEGKSRLASEIKRMAKFLHGTARKLDECYPKHSEDHDLAEQRLVLTCRVIVSGLADLLGRITHALFGIDAHRSPRPHQARPSAKRSIRLARIEALKLELIEHIRSARDHAFALVDSGQAPQLLPRPSQAQLGRRADVPPHAVSRCFKDPQAHELRLLWDKAIDLEQIMRLDR